MQEEPVWQQLDERLDNSPLLAPARLKKQREINARLTRSNNRLGDMILDWKRAYAKLQRQLSG